jgi:EmrB/QacA subfamily drug resistance transporter
MTSLVGATRQRWTLLATGLGLFMILVDTTVVNVALPDIQAEFGADEADLQWVVAAYSLTMAMFMMSAASAADRRGRRSVYLVGIGVFVAASVACGLAPSLPILDVARAGQGAGAAMVNVASLALVGSAFTDPAAKARAIGVWTGVATVGLALGPTLGGVLTEQLGWRSVFVVNPFIGAVAMVLTVTFVAESRDPVDRRFDLPGQALFIIGIGALTYALVQGPQDGWLSPLVAGPLVGGMAVAGAFIVTELRRTNPMMDVRVFTDRAYAAAIVTVFVVLFCVYGTALMTTQYLQNVLAQSPQTAGLTILAMTGPMVLVAPLSGHLVVRYGARRPTMTGVALVALAMGVVALGAGRLLAVTVVGLLILGVGGGLTLAPATGIAMSSLDPDRSGMASGILSVQRALGSTAGFAIMGSVLAAVIGLTLPGALEPLVPDEATRGQAVEAVQRVANPQAVTSVIGAARGLPDTVTERDLLVTATDDAFVAGIRAAQLVACVLALGALALGWRRLPRGAPPTERAELAASATLGDDDEAGSA